MKNITIKLAEILGLLCAEGSHIIAYSSYWGKDRGRDRFFTNNKSERIEFYNKDIKLLKHYQKLLFDEFEYSPKITKHNKINICKMNIIRSIILQTPLGHMKWTIPLSVKESKREVKIAFVRGFFDGDGTVSNRVRFFSSNPDGIKQLSDLLRDLDFKHTIQGPIKRENHKDSFVIQISQKERESFLKEIKPISKC
tara:strand:- start:321 stop:908 length:588 start_codon:yes stop_codon:yes gene_type:complete